MRVLLIDDEPHALKYVVRALERAGYVITVAATTQTARKQFYFPGFSLIILDRMMPAGTIMQGDDYTPDVNTGFRLLGRLREIPGLDLMPVIIFTNFYERELAIQWEAGDQRLKVCPKSLTPEAFVAIVKEFTATWPFQSEYPDVPVDEHPNVAPYYVQDVDSGTFTRVSFDHFTESEAAAFIASGRLDSWVFGNVFAKWLEGESTRPHVLRLTCSHDLASEYVLGLYYEWDLASNRAWYETTLFETSPEHQRDSVSRRYKYIGKVLLARFIRERLLHEGALNGFINLGMVRVERGELQVGAVVSGRRFLESMGFTPDGPARTKYSISPNLAEDLLRHTSRPGAL